MSPRDPSAEELFNEVLDLPVAERVIYLRHYSSELRADVEAMLEAYRVALESPGSKIQPGATFGRYLIQQSLGAGGMGEV